MKKATLQSLLFAGLTLSVLVLSGCAGSNSGRYYQRDDSAPLRLPAKIELADAKPKHEEYASATLRPYTVLGKKYHPLGSAKGYSQHGKASWYGQKFHGHKTANGEVYDMYKMTAAHKTLPLPSYVRVTNLANGRQVVVKVNDRGPFHSDRIIDLSYVAALKLDYLKTGIAEVKLDVIHVDKNGDITIGDGPTIAANSETQTNNAAQKSWFVQVAALQDQEKITQLASGLTSLYQVPAYTPSEQGIYRLRLGPLQTEQQASALVDDLKRSGYAQAYKLYVPH